MQIDASPVHHSGQAGKPRRIGIQVMSAPDLVWMVDRRVAQQIVLGLGLRVRIVVLGAWQITAKPLSAMSRQRACAPPCSPGGAGRRKSEPQWKVLDDSSRFDNNNTPKNTPEGFPPL